MTPSILEPLNKSQREAVAAPAANILVLAGAGSGKTRVLVHRDCMVYKRSRCQPPCNSRRHFYQQSGRPRFVHALVPCLANRSAVCGSGHFTAWRTASYAVHWREADLPRDFTIIDSGDQYRTIRRVLKLLEIDEAQLSPKDAQHAINRHKENNYRSQHIDDQDDHQLYRVYTAYEEICRRSGVVDFTELLLRVHKLLYNQATILQHYQQRFPVCLG